MTGEGQFLEHGEDADLVTFGAFGVSVAWKDKGGLAKIGFARQLLHLVVAKTASVGEDCELIALQRL